MAYGLQTAFRRNQTPMDTSESLWDPVSQPRSGPEPTYVSSEDISSSTSASITGSEDESTDRSTDESIYESAYESPSGSTSDLISEPTSVSANASTSALCASIDVPITFSLLQLPDEIVCNILTSLHPMSRACLSLSCKRFFWLTGSVLSSDELLPPPLAWVDEHQWRVPRTWSWVFLGLLEDKRWLRCAACIKLHPRADFSSWDRDLSSSPSHTDVHRTCQACHARGGIVYFCPCIRMTFRQKLRLISQLEKTLDRKWNFGEDGDVWHKCEKSYQSATVKIQIKTALLENGDLTVQTEYDIECDRRENPLEGLPYFCCPHSDIGRLPNRVTEDCDYCDSSVTNFKSSRRHGKLCYSIQTVRNLGCGGTKADITWEHQRSSAYFNPSRFRKPLRQL